MNVNNLLIYSFSAIYMLHDMPMLGFRYPSMVYAGIVILLFLMLLLKIGTKSVLKILPIFLIPVLDVMISSSNMLIFFQGVSVCLQNMILPMLAIYLCAKNHLKMSKWLFSIYLTINLITCFTTYTGCQIFPNASRELVMGDASKSPLYYVYLNANIGGFSFVYSMVLLLVLVICTIKNYKEINKSKLILIIAIIFSIGIVMAVIAAEYTMAILLMSICLFFLFVKRKFNIKRMLSWGISLLLIFCTFKPFIGEGLMTIANNVESQNVSNRLIDLSLYLEGKHTSDNSDVDARGETYAKSLISFMDNPLGEWNLKSIGGHSYIFDALGKYGLLGFFILIISFKRIFNSYIKTLRGTFLYGYAVVGFLLFIVMATLNPKAFTNFLLFVLPIYALLFVNNEKNA